MDGEDGVVGVDGVVGMVGVVEVDGVVGVVGLVELVGLVWRKKLNVTPQKKEKKNNNLQLEGRYN